MKRGGRWYGKVRKKMKIEPSSDRKKIKMK